MRLNGNLRILVPVICLGFVSQIQAQNSPFGEARKTLQGTRRSATPMQDDANLYAISFIGKQVGWVVGDRSAIWQTTDGGKTWQFKPSPVKANFKSVCFLTDRVGWIAGGYTTPFTRVSQGVLLFTQDGGLHWKVFSGPAEKISRDVLKNQNTTGQPSRNSQSSPSQKRLTLPFLHKLKFFDLNHGVAAGEINSDFPTGIMKTADGGQSWEPIAGNEVGNWRAADFLDEKNGIIVGVRGQMALLGNGQLVKTQTQLLKNLAIRDVVLDHKLRGWIVGDGGMVSVTENSGITWSPPRTLLPKNIEDVFNFRAVAAIGEKVWIAGRPGSVIWHSPDGGKTWKKQPTGQTVPINKIYFLDEYDGFAVGALGTILKTENGGLKWQIVRGSHRRAAILTFQARPQRVPFPLIAKYAADEGYRTVSILPARRDLGPDGYLSTNEDIRLNEAVIEAGGSDSEIFWRYPLTIPGVEHEIQQLWKDWNLRNEGKLKQRFPNDLVAMIRTWRPTVIVIDEPPEDDATSMLIASAVSQAVNAAADSSRFVPLLELANLKPWQVEQVFWKLPDGSIGHTQIDLHDLLPRVGKSVYQAATNSASMLLKNYHPGSNRNAFLLVGGRGFGDRSAIVSRRFFGGTVIAPGSEARRRLLSIDSREFEKQRLVIQRQRNFLGYSKRFLDDSRHAGQLIAKLGDITKGMKDEQAALQLYQLAEEYKRRQQWELVEAVMIELMERYPRQPATRQAMTWMLKFWTGAEPVWQRVRHVNVQRQQLMTDRSAMVYRIRRAQQIARRPLHDRVLAELDLGPDPAQVVNTPNEAFDRNRQRQAKGVDHWQKQAVYLASFIRRVDPELYKSPEVQFSVASLMRKRNIYRVSDEVYRRMLRSGLNAQWKQAANTEIWMMNPQGQPPRKIALCRRTAERPHLDGVLSETCWQQATAMPLTQDAQTNPNLERGSFVMISYDTEYFYFAASILRHPELPVAKPETKNRKHDEDLSKQDRVSFYLDLDRDYGTWYTLTVDQRGKTNDVVWQDSTWNPQWSVAIDADDTHWRIEAAIPFSELASRPPMANRIWALGVVRTIPGVGLESWSHPAGITPRPESFGLLKFH